MIGPAVPRIADGLELLARAAHEHGKPIADYVVTGEAPGAVMILARHDSQEAAALQWFKMGDGPLYRMVRPYHLCHLEILKTLRRATAGGAILLDNGPRPTISVAAIAKCNITAGERIKQGIGSFYVRGECVRMLEHPGHLPIALLHSALLTRNIEAGGMIMVDDVEIPDSAALKAWRAVEQKTLADGART
jgi:predicted homoserine dehydrogenase-like protein